MTTPADTTEAPPEETVEDEAAEETVVEEATTTDVETPSPTDVADEDAPETAPVRRRKGKRQLAHAQAHIKATFNNTIITITDLKGEVLAWTSGGSVGFKGSRKSTPYAAQVAAELAARKAGEMGIRKVDVIVRGSGSGRETAIRTLQNMGIEIAGIKDVTPVPHNGCRPKKRKGR